MFKISNPRSLKDGSLGFNAVSINGILIKGFTMRNGYLNPPCYSYNRGSGYYPNCYLSKPRAEELYDAVRLVLEEKGVSLKEFKVAVKDLLLTPELFDKYIEYPDAKGVSVPVQETSVADEEKSPLLSEEAKAMITPRLKRQHVIASPIETKNLLMFEP